MKCFVRKESWCLFAFFAFHLQAVAGFSLAWVTACPDLSCCETYNPCARLRLFGQTRLRPCGTTPPGTAFSRAGPWQRPLPRLACERCSLPGSGSGWGRVPQGLGRGPPRDVTRRGAAGRPGGAWGGSERSRGVEPRGFLVPGRVGAAAGHGSPGRGEGGSTHRVVCSPPAGRHGVPAWVSHMAARSGCIVITAA